MNKQKKIPTVRFKGFTDDWEQRKLGELVNYVNGKGHEEQFRKAKTHNYELITLKSIDENGNLCPSNKYIDSANSTLSKDDLIMILSEQNKGLVGITTLIPKDDYYVLNQRIALLKNLKNNSPLFLKSSINRHQFYFERMSAGTKVQNISKSNVENFRLYIPNKNEQGKIGRLLLTIDSIITLQQRKLDLLKQLKKGLLQKEVLKEALLDQHSNWTSYKLKDLLSVRKQLQQPDASYPLSSFTADKGVTPKTIRYNREFLVRTNNKKYKITEYNDVVYNPANLKFGAIALNTYGKASISPIYETLVPSNCDPYFLSLVITSHDFVQKALKYQEGTVYERMAVKVNDFLSLSVKLPNMDEQKKIGKLFSDLDNLIQIQDNNLVKYQLVKKSLLQQMFI